MAWRGVAGAVSWRAAVSSPYSAPRPGRSFVLLLLQGTLGLECRCVRALAALIPACAVDRGGTNKARGRSSALRRRVTGPISPDCDQASTDLPALCSPASPSYQWWSVWPWERSDETGGGGGRGSLSVIRSGFVSLRRDLLLEPALEIPAPPPTAPARSGALCC